MTQTAPRSAPESRPPLAAARLLAAMLAGVGASVSVGACAPEVIPAPAPEVFVTRASVADDMPGWDRLRAAFCSDGFITLSPVLFDATRSVALVARGHRTSTMVGSSELVVFRRQPSGWIMEAYRLLSYA